MTTTCQLTLCNQFNILYEHRLKSAEKLRIKRNNVKVERSEENILYTEQKYMQIYFQVKTFQMNYLLDILLIFSYGNFLHRSYQKQKHKK